MWSIIAGFRRFMRLAPVAAVAGCTLGAALVVQNARAQTPGGPRRSEANRELALRWNDAITRHNTGLLDDFVSPDIVDHNPQPFQGPGLQGVKDGLEGFFAGYPDVRIDVLDVLVQGDLVVDHVVSHGTNTGSLFGMPPTGRSVTVEAYDLYRVRNGRITDLWHLEDLYGEFVQLGVIIPPGQ